MGSASNGSEAAQGAIVGRTTAINADLQRSAEERMQKQQLHAMSLHVAGQERLLRLEVLKIAAAFGYEGPTEAVKAAEAFWAFLTAGDPKPAEDVAA